jgi:hypothetical protein
MVRRTELRVPRLSLGPGSLFGEAREQFFAAWRLAQRIVIEARDTVLSELSVEGSEKECLMSAGILFDGQPDLEAGSTVLTS